MEQPLCCRVGPGSLSATQAMRCPVDCQREFAPLLLTENNETDSKRTGCTVLTEATLGVYGRLGRWMRRED